MEAKKKRMTEYKTLTVKWITKMDWNSDNMHGCLTRLNVDKFLFGCPACGVIMYLDHDVNVITLTINPSIHCVCDAHFWVKNGEVIV